jgi:hypothetical protein
MDPEQFQQFVIEAGMEFKDREGLFDPRRVVEAKILVAFQGWLMAAYRDELSREALANAEEDGVDVQRNGGV